MASQQKFEGKKRQKLPNSNWRSAPGLLALPFQNQNQKSPCLSPKSEVKNNKIDEVLPSYAPHDPFPVPPFQNQNQKSPEVENNKLDKSAQQNTKMKNVPTELVGDAKCSKWKMSDEEFAEYKKRIRERNKMAMQRPKLFLTPDEMLSTWSSTNEADVTTPPLYAGDLQSLLLFALQKNLSSSKPRWCKLLRVNKVSSVVLISMDGIGYKDFLENKTNFTFIEETFKIHAEMICPDQYGSTMRREIGAVPLSITQIKKISMKVPDDLRAQVATMLMPENGPSSSCSILRNTEDKFPRTSLLLSTTQMQQEGYPLPVETADHQYKDFVFTKDHYDPVHDNSPLFALDCEMCLTTIQQNELTRVSVVDEDGNLLYDALVKPRNKIINYLTRYSGITKQMLDPINKRIEDVQKDLSELFPGDAIICGQSLNSDLIALKMFHPYVIDTSVIYNMTGNKKIKSGLRKLTATFLNRSIQDNPTAGHCSTEDAIATLDLVKLKLKNGLEFGDATITGVYFPSVKTYFMGKDGQSGKNGQPAVVENVETEAKKDTLKRPHPDDSSNSPAKKLKTTDDKSGNNFLTKMSAQQFSLFNQNKSAQLKRSIFRIIDEAGITGSLIDRDAFLSEYEKEPIEKCTVLSDKQACKSAQTAVQNKEFTWVNFHKFREAFMNSVSTPDLTESVNKKLDARVRRVVTKCKDKSLVILNMTGRKKGNQVTNGGVFVHISSKE